MSEIKIDEATAREINKKYIESLQNYKRMMTCMVADVPIETLCLPKTVQTILLKNGFRRVFELIDLDLTEIKGIGVLRARDLASRLNQFIAMG
jgi:hypothetical protein